MRYEFYPNSRAKGGSIDLDRARRAVKENGGMRPREAYINGWNNQPRTITFAVSSGADLKRIECAYGQDCFVRTHTNA